MSTYIDQALELIDKLIETAKQNQNEYGAAFSPVSPGGLRIDLRRQIKEVIGDKTPDSLRQEIAALETTLNNSYSEIQKGFKAALEGLDRQIKNIPPLPQDRLDELNQEMLAIQEEMEDSLTPQQKKIRKELPRLRIHLDILSDKKLESDLVEAIVGSLTTKKCLTIEVPDKERYDIALLVIEEALRRKGLMQLEANEEGYSIDSDPLGNVIRIEATASAKPIDLGELREEIDVNLRRELSNPAKWNKKRSSRGLVYEHTQPINEPDLTYRICDTLEKGGEYRKVLKIDVKRKGAYLGEGMFDVRLGEELPADAQHSIRVMGADTVKTILSEGFGVQGLDLGPAPESRAR